MKKVMSHLFLLASYNRRVYFIECPLRAVTFAEMFKGKIEIHDGYYIVTI
jgi:hypothetical protein